MWKIFPKVEKIFTVIYILMRIPKKCLSLMFAPLINGFVIGASDINGPLVQKEGERIYVNPIMTESLVKELHYLNKRSYRITNRGENQYDYLYPEKLTRKRRNMFSIIKSFSGEVEFQESDWDIHEPFTGIHGTNRLRGGLGVLPASHQVELDYSGFVALSKPRFNVKKEMKRPPIIAVVFRGSQSKSFQKLGGILGPSWLTNFSANKMQVPDNLSMRGALFHKGFLEKYLSARINILAHIQELWKTIPEEFKKDTRFIITGHSQGAGVAIPAALDIVGEFGKKFFGDNFSNVETPRFFVYALSGPNPTGDSKTKEMINRVIGRDNIIRHNSIFDIVTYVCLGKNYDKWFYNMFLNHVAGVESGYHPVGHLAIDDTRMLFLKGLEYNKEYELMNSLDEIDDLLKKIYSQAIRSRQSAWYVSCFYKALEAWYLARGMNAVNGIKNFVYINHYGSITANSNCKPVDRKSSSQLRLAHRGIRSFGMETITEDNLEDLRERIEIFDKEQALGLKEKLAIEVESDESLGVLSETSSDRSSKVVESDEEKYSASFDPRLPEVNLTSCLARGAEHRNLIFNLKRYENPEQVFPMVQINLQDDDKFTEYNSEDAE